MVPAVLMMMEELPRTASGKIDRKALPAPEWKEQEASDRGARICVEEILQGIFAEVLGRRE